MSNPVYLALDLPRLEQATALVEKVKAHIGGVKPVSYTHLTLPTSDLV